MGNPDLGCCGSETETPVLDALGAKGLRFTGFYTVTEGPVPNGTWLRPVFVAEMGSFVASAR